MPLASTPQATSLFFFTLQIRWLEFPMLFSALSSFPRFARSLGAARDVPFGRAYGERPRCLRRGSVKQRNRTKKWWERNYRRKPSYSVSLSRALYTIRFCTYLSLKTIGTQLTAKRSTGNREIVRQVWAIVLRTQNSIVFKPPDQWQGNVHANAVHSRRWIIALLTSWNDEKIPVQSPFQTPWG